MKDAETFNASFEQREALTEKTVAMFGDYAFSGVGVGNFQYAYPKYQGSELFKKRYVRFAHNDWAQFLSEAGIAGMGLLLSGIFYYVFKTMHLWARRSDPYAVCLGVVPIVALAYIAVHSYSDFNLHVPANFLLLAAIMAIGYAALHLERHQRRDVMGYRYYELPLKYKGGVVLALILGLIGWTGYNTLRHFMGEVYCHTVPNDPLHHEAWAKAVWHYRKAQSLETGGKLKRMKKEIREYVWRFYPDEGYVGEVLRGG